MKILLTGANGYIGQRLLPELLKEAHDVVCLVRDPRRFDISEYEENRDYYKGNISVIQGDLLNRASLNEIPQDIDVAYYLVHSMSSAQRHHLEELEERSANNFVDALNQTDAKQVVYLSGISNDSDLSEHLESRRAVEDVLARGNFALTVLRAAIIIGSGSASFEIIRDLVEKLPFMVAPKWLNVKCQPIAIRNVVHYLTGVLLKEKAFDRIFDIGGPDVLTYREMLLKFAEIRGLRRFILTVPVLTPRLSALWLYLITSTTFQLARNLVDSMRNEVICQKKGIDEIVQVDCFSYEEAIEKAFVKIEQNEVVSSWTDALVKGVADHFYLDNVKVPRFGCLFDEVVVKISGSKDEANRVRENIWKLGGDSGWYYMDWAWQLRGWLDKLVQGVGLRKWRRHPSELREGDAIDFWRVLLADEDKRHLILYAEMKLPGEAWLEFQIENEEGVYYLRQKAIFRPKGLSGRLYWYVLTPVHFFIFKGMAQNIVNHRD